MWGGGFSRKWLTAHPDHPISRDRDLRMVRRWGAKLLHRMSSGRCYSGRSRRRERVMVGTSASLLLVCLGVVFVFVEGRSGRVYSGVSNENSIDVVVKEGSENVTLVFGKSVSESQCNSTLCSVSRVRPKRFKLSRNVTVVANRRNDFRLPSRGLLPPYESGGNARNQGFAGEGRKTGVERVASGSYTYPKPQQDEPASGYNYPKPQQDESSSGYKYPKPQQDEPANGYNYPKPQQDEPSSGYKYPKPQQDEPASGYNYPKPQQDESSTGYNYPKPQQDEPSTGYNYPKPQQDEPSSGYKYPKPQQDEPASGYNYPKPQQDEPSSGYKYPKPQQDEPASGYNYPKPQQDESSTGYNYPKPQQDEPSTGYNYPKPQQDEPDSGYNYPKPQQDDPTSRYPYWKIKEDQRIDREQKTPNSRQPTKSSYRKEEQDELTNGYSYPKPQQDEPADGYSYPKPQQDQPTDGYKYPKPQEDESTNGYSYPKPQQDEPVDGYSYRKPSQGTWDGGSASRKPANTASFQASTFADAVIEDYSKRYSPGTRNPLSHNKQGHGKASTSGASADTPWKPMIPPNRVYPRTSAPFREDPIDIPTPSSDGSLKNKSPASGFRLKHGVHSHKENAIQPNWPISHASSSDVTYDYAPETDLVPPNMGESLWKLYGPPLSDDPPKATYGPPTPQPTRPPQEDPPDAYLPPQHDDPPPATYGPPRPQPTKPPQEDPADSYLPPQNDPEPPRPTYGVPKPQPTKPPQDDPIDIYPPSEGNLYPPPPIYGVPKPQPQEDPVDSYLPPQNDPKPSPTYGPPRSKPSRPSQEDQRDSYLPPQSDPIPPSPTYGPPKPRPTRPPQNDPADSYLPPQNDPIPPSPTYGPPKPRPTRPPQNDPGDSYLPPQNDPIPPSPSYGPPKPRPTRPPQNDPADSYLPLQNDPIPPSPSYGPPKPRPTQPPQEDPVDSYLPPQNDPRPPSPTYGPAKTRPPQDDPVDSYLPPQNDPKPPPTYGPPKPQATRPPQEEPQSSYLPPQNDPAPPRPSYGPPKPQEDPPQNDPRPPVPSYGPPQEQTTQDTPSTSYLPEVEDNKSYLSPPLLDAPSGSYDDTPSPVYIPYELPLQEENDGNSQRQVFPPIEASRPGQTRILRVPGGLQPNDIHVTDLRCWRSAPTSVFAFTLWTTKKMAATPVLVTSESSSICRLRTDPAAPRSRFLVRLAHSDLSRCGVRPCSHNGEERMCVSLQLPQLSGLRLASDPQLEVSCAPPPPSDWSLKQLRMAAAAPALGPPELRVKGGRSPMHSQLQLFRRSAPAGTWRRLEASQAVILGEELQLRAIVRDGDGWQSSKISDVIVRRTSSGEDLKSSSSLSDSTSAISARLVSPEGCPNPDMEDVTGLQSWLAGDPLISTLPIRVFMFRGQKDGEQLIISARVTACQDRLHCRMDPHQCKAANVASRVKRTTASEATSLLQNKSQEIDITSWESEISLRVLLPPSGSRSEGDIVQPRWSVPVMASSVLVLLAVSAAAVILLVVGNSFAYQRGLR